eukprot:129759-Pleurochrysis_carterae.AAC.3
MAAAMRATTNAATAMRTTTTAAAAMRAGNARDNDSGSNDSIGGNARGNDSGYVGDGDLAALANVCRLRSKLGLADKFVCGGSVASAAAVCIRGTCDAWGFKQFWSSYLHNQLVPPGFQQLRADAHQLWLSKIKWERLKSGGARSPGDTQKAEATIREEQ